MLYEFTDGDAGRGIRTRKLTLFLGVYLASEDKCLYSFYGEKNPR